MDKPDVPQLKNFESAVSPDGKLIALNFVDSNDVAFQVALGQDQISQIVTAMLETSQKAEEIAPSRNREVVEGTPLTIGGLGVGPGRIPTEAMLSISVGPTTLLFAVDLSRLLEMGDLLRSKTTRLPQKTN